MGKLVGGDIRTLSGGAGAAALLGMAATDPNIRESVQSGLRDFAVAYYTGISRKLGGTPTEVTCPLQRRALYVRIETVYRDMSKLSNELRTATPSPCTGIDFRLLPSMDVQASDHVLTSRHADVATHQMLNFIAAMMQILVKKTTYMGADLVTYDTMTKDMVASLQQYYDRPPVPHTPIDQAVQDELKKLMEMEFSMSLDARLREIAAQGDENTQINMISRAVARPLIHAKDKNEFNTMQTAIRTRSVHNGITDRAKQYLNALVSVNKNEVFGLTL